MRYSPVLFVALLAHVALATTAPAQSTAAHAVPVHREPRHHLVYENALARVLEVRAPAGDTTLWHVHADRMLTVRIAGAGAWNQEPGHDRQAAEAAPAVGSVSDNG